MLERKIRVGNKVRMLKDKNETGISRLNVGTVGTVIYIDDNVPQYQVGYAGHYYWYDEDELELVEDDVSVKKIDICSNIQRNVTVEEVEKLEEELRRKDSELRDLKELIIKLLFDRYGY